MFRLSLWCFGVFVGPCLHWAINWFAENPSVATMGLFIFFTAHFQAKTPCGYNLAAASSLSSWWQVNIHFHPNTCPTSTACDLWEVDSRRDRCCSSFLQAWWCHGALCRVTSPQTCCCKKAASFAAALTQSGRTRRRVNSSEFCTRERD